jgi:hypothetical protein
MLRFVFCVSIAACISACGPTRLDLTPIGGAWHFYLHSSPIIEAGSRQTDIYREWNGRQMLVASDVEFHEYYAGPDCLLWETSHKDHVVYAACDDRAPMVSRLMTIIAGQWRSAAWWTRRIRASAQPVQP